MPNPDLPDLVLAHDEEEWKKCMIALVYALTDGRPGKIQRWQGQLKMVIQSYADLYKEGKIDKPYEPENPQDFLLARQELLKGYDAIEKYEEYLKQQAKPKEVENGTSR